MTNGKQPPLSVQQLYAIIGQLTVENQLLRAQIDAMQRASEAKTMTEANLPPKPEKVKGARA